MMHLILGRRTCIDGREVEKKKRKRRRKLIDGELMKTEDSSVE